MEALEVFSFAEFHFLRPWWLLAIIPALILAGIFLKQTLWHTEWKSAIQPELLEVLLEDGGKRSNRWISVFTAAGLLLTALALAGPTWNRLPQRVEQANDALVIVLDLSYSMYAEDLAPSRLVHARHKIADILRMREEGYTALVVFAGDAHVVTPLTDDTDTIENLLSSLQPGMMPVAGSNPQYAVEQARNLIHSANLLQGRILILTDGIRDPRDITQFANPDIPISILGIGTAEGAPIPLSFMNRPGEFLPDAQGQTVIAKLDINQLRTTANASYGRFKTSTIGDADILYVLDTQFEISEETEEVDRQFDVWADRGYLLLLFVIPILAMGFRRGALLVLCLVILPSPVHASMVGDLWDGLWQRKDQQAYSALNAGQPERAAQLFEQSDWRATADYRSGAFDAAAQAYEALEQKYNQGNALAKLGDYQGAISAYENVLSANPDHEDALFNKQLVEKLQEQKQQEESEQDNSEEQQESEENQDSDTSQQDSDGEPGEEQDENTDQNSEEENSEEEEKEQNQEQGNEQEEKQSESTADQQNRDEQQEAMEQWIRRVPDDPGGLLKRKFQHETNQRLRRGEYQRSGSEQVW